MTELAKAYFRWLNGNASNEWAHDRVDELFFENPDNGWLLILELIEAAPSKYALCYVAAGYLEILMRDDGMEFIGRIREETWHNRKLLYCLTAINLDKTNPVYSQYMSILHDNLLPGAAVEDLVDLPEDLRPRKNSDGTNV